jgi:hypothetical protein
MDPEPTFHFDMYTDPAFQFDPDPTDTDLDPYRFKEVMYLKQYRVLFIHLNLICLVRRSNRTQPKGIIC